MTMHDQLPEAPDRFDVGPPPTPRTPRTPRTSDEPASAQESTAATGTDATSAPAADAPPLDPDVIVADAEVARLEKLLAVQSRQRREIAAELARRSELLRDALIRLSDVAPRQDSQQLRGERDAAVARAVEAELARAEVTFQLDEALGFLRTGPNAAMPLRSTAVSAAQASEVRALKARVAELEELSQTADARRLLIEDELAHEQARLTGVARDRVEALERVELQLSEISARRDDAQRRRLQAEDARFALEGEVDGIRFRAREAERALLSTQERLTRAERIRAELKDKLESARAEQAAHAARAEAHAVRVQELLATRSGDQETTRQLRAELQREQALRAEEATQLSAAQGKLALLESAARTIDSAQAGSEPGSAQRSELEALRGVLLDLRLPLVALESSLADLGRGGSRKPGEAREIEIRTSDSSAPVDPKVVATLEEELRIRAARIEQLEAKLTAPRDVNVTTLKGELIDVRANAARLQDDLAKERSRRRKIAVTVRALQAATDSGEAPGPWIDELVAVVNEGASLPPKS